MLTGAATTACNAQRHSRHRARPPATLPAGLAQQEPVQRILPSGVYSIRLEQGRAGCEFRGEQLQRRQRRVSVMAGPAASCSYLSAVTAHM